MKTTARVVLWKSCNRDCVLCCNKQESVITAGITVSDMSYIVGYEEVLLTGGEPMLAPERVIEFAQEARKYNPNCRIYLYTALCPWNPIMHKVIEAVDGVHFALHAPASDEDIMGFQFMQSLAKEYPDKSFRLHFDADLDIPISLNPSVWDRIESKPWLIDCPVPENETLYFIESMVD